jgi:hypothetical protein
VSLTVAENTTMDGPATLASPSNTMIGTTKPESRGFTSNQHARSRIHIPTYRNIKPRVDTWLRLPKIEGEMKEVSGAVTCRVVQM